MASAATFGGLAKTILGGFPTSENQGEGTIAGSIAESMLDAVGGGVTSQEASTFLAELKQGFEQSRDSKKAEYVCFALFVEQALQFAPDTYAPHTWAGKPQNTPKVEKAINSVLSQESGQDVGYDPRWAVDYSDCISVIQGTSAGWLKSVFSAYVALFPDGKHKLYLASYPYSASLRPVSNRAAYECVENLFRAASDAGIKPSVYFRQLRDTLLQKLAPVA